MGEHKRQVEELRREIAKLDAGLVAGLNARAQASRTLGEILTKHSIDLHKDGLVGLPLVERSSLHAGVEASTGAMPVESLRDIFREIVAACLALERPANVAYCGPEGGLGHAVARGYFGASATFISCDTTALALDEVAKKRGAFAMLPYETHSEGPVQTTVAALTASELRIVAVVEASPNLHLLRLHGSVDDLEKVYVTPADRVACEHSLAELGVKVGIVDVKSPLLACQLAVEDRTAAGVATESMAASLGLEVAKRNILDRPDSTRYAIVGTRPATRTGEDATAVVFSVSDSPGALLDVLRTFAEGGINLSKIHSRPVEAEGWRYMFFVEVAGHVTDRMVVTAFEETKRLTKFFKVLGSFPVRLLAAP